MIFSKEQVAIENEVKTGTGNIAVQAGPGSGKTFILLKCLGVIPVFKKTIFMSFSKTIVDELRAKVPRHVKACTLHSLGYGMVLNRYPGLTLDEGKYLKIALKMFPHTPKGQVSKEGKDIFKKACFIKDVVDFIRMTLTPLKHEDVQQMCNYYSLEYTTETIDKAIQIVSDITKVSFTTIDFVDMLYIPVLKPDMVQNKYDYICYDEVQDANKCQLEFLSLIGHERSRYIIVGDSYQSIYAFAGANVDSFDQARKRFNCKLFTLPVSYRCPKNVVEFAQGVYDVIQYHEGAKDGDVRMGTIEEVVEGDMVLCRNTLPLIFAFFQLLERNVKAMIVGSDIAKGLIEFAKQIGGWSFEQIDRNMDSALAELKHELKELGFQKPEKHKKYGALVEKIQVMNIILSKIDHPSKLLAKINEIFHEDKKAAKLLTLHKSKGTEGDRVFIIESFQGKVLVPSQYAEKDWEFIQEANLSYVGITRSKNELILIDA